MQENVVIIASTMAQALVKVRRDLGADAMILHHEEREGNVHVTARRDMDALLGEQNFGQSTKQIEPSQVPQLALANDTFQSEATIRSTNTASLGTGQLNDPSQLVSAQPLRAVRETIDVREHADDVREHAVAHATSGSFFEEPLTAIGALCDICHYHQLGDTLADAWLNAMNLEFTTTPIRLDLALSRVIPHDSNWFDSLSPTAQIALVGPPGSGKTATVAKLAAMLVAAGRGVRVITLDIVKSAGARQLETYLKPLNIKLEVGHKALTLLQKPVITLIDTPGLNVHSPHDFTYLQALRSSLSSPFTVVFGSDMNPTEAIDMSACYRVLGAENLIVTRLDVARRYGTLLRTAHDGLKLVMTAKSPALSDGLYPVEMESLLQYMLNSCEVNE